MAASHGRCLCRGLVSRALRRLVADRPYSGTSNDRSGFAGASQRQHAGAYPCIMHKSDAARSSVLVVGVECSAVLPWGATEAHNRHLPYGTDVYECDHVAAEAGRLAWEAGARVAILPTVPFGVNSGQLEIPMTLHVSPEGSKKR